MEKYAIEKKIKKLWYENLLQNTVEISVVILVLVGKGGA